MTDDDSASAGNSSENFSGNLNKTERSTANISSHGGNVADFDMEAFCKECFDIIDGNQATLALRKNQVNVNFDCELPAQVYMKHK